MDAFVSEWAVDELIDRCSRRPIDEIAWQEFVRRFHPSIRASVFGVFARLAVDQRGVNQESIEDIIHDLVQDVYRRLIDNDSAALKRITCTRVESMKNYLLLVSINAVRDYFRRGIAPTWRPGKPALVGTDGPLTRNAIAVLKLV